MHFILDLAKADDDDSGLSGEMAVKMMIGTGKSEETEPEKDTKMKKVC